jgi:hypothetical protein
MLRDELQGQFGFRYVEPRMMNVLLQFRQNTMVPIKWRRGCGYTDAGHYLHDDRTAATECALCHQENPAQLKRCGGCKFEHYCSRRCQQQHWSTIHKHECKKIQHILGVLANDVYIDLEVQQSLHDLLLMNDWLSAALTKNPDLMYRDLAVNIISELRLYPSFVDAFERGRVSVPALASTIWTIFEYLGGRPDRRQRLATTELMYMVVAHAWDNMGTEINLDAVELQTIVWGSNSIGGYRGMVQKLMVVQISTGMRMSEVLDPSVLVHTIGQDPTSGPTS